MARKKQKTVYIMLKEDTKRLLRMIVSQRQFKTANSVSDDDALYAYIETHSPELIAALEEQKLKEQEEEKEMQP